MEGISACHLYLFSLLSLPLPHEGEKRTCVCLMKWAGRGEGGGRGRAGRRRNENCGEKGRRGRERKEQPIKAVDCFGREEENTKSGHGKRMRRRRWKDWSRGNSLGPRLSRSAKSEAAGERKYFPPA